MDKSVLIQYADMKEEVKDLRKRIVKLEKEIKKIDIFLPFKSIPSFFSLFYHHDDSIATRKINLRFL